MAKLKDGHFSGLSNLFTRGKKGLAAILNGKPDHADFYGIADLAPGAPAEDVGAKVNEILAKLKTPAA